MYIAQISHLFVAQPTAHAPRLLGLLTLPTVGQLGQTTSMYVHCTDIPCTPLMLVAQPTVQTICGKWLVNMTTLHSQVSRPQKHLLISNRNTGTCQNGNGF